MTTEQKCKSQGGIWQNNQCYYSQPQQKKEQQTGKRTLLFIEKFIKYLTPKNLKMFFGVLLIIGVIILLIFAFKPLSVLLF